MYLSFSPSMLIPLTLRVPLESVVCYFHTFENNLEIKQKFTKYLMDSCCLVSDEHFSFKFFPKDDFVAKIYPKLSGLFWLLKNLCVLVLWTKVASALEGYIVTQEIKMTLQSVCRL